LAASIITCNKRSGIADVGKPLGLLLDILEASSGSLAWWDHRDAMLNGFSELGIDPEVPRFSNWLN
jgi:hypothetical protein